MEKVPDFNKIQPEITRDNAKDLSMNFFSRRDSIMNLDNQRDRANTLQGQLNDLKIKINEDKNEEINKDKDKDIEKKKIKLNVGSPKFTAKANPKNDELTFNPLNSINNAFNKFDEYDSSANQNEN